MAEDEAQLDPREFFERRSRAVKRMKEENNPNPYPHKFHVTTDMKQFMKDYESLEKGEEEKDVEVRVGARIYSMVGAACLLNDLSCFADCMCSVHLAAISFSM